MTCKITNCIHESEHGCMGCVKYQPEKIEIVEVEDESE